MVNTQDYIIKKYNVEVGKQYVVEIPEIVGAVGLAQLFFDLGYTLGAEIGTDQGEYAEVLAQTIPQLTLFCIDPWMAEAYEPNQQPESKEDQKYFDIRYLETFARLAQYDTVNIVRKTSMDALGEFEDNSLDFVYIDGNHDFLNVTQDMHYWFKKVRSGGILAGHDYVRYPSRKFNHVQKVVNAYTSAYHLLPVFTTAPTDQGLKRDRYRSWFLVKL